MSKRILLLSNSHGAAIYRAIKKNGQPKGYHIHVIAVGGNPILSEISFSGNEMTTVNKSILQQMSQIPDAFKIDRIDLSRIDHIVLYGCRLMHETDRILFAKQSSQVYSSAARERALYDYIQNDLQYQFCTQLRDDAIKRKILSIPSPPPNEKHPGIPPKKSVNSEILTSIQRFLQTEFNKVSVAAMPIPDEIYAQKYLTAKAKFNNGLTTRGTPDMVHLNPEGGRIIIDAFIQALSQ